MIFFWRSSKSSRKRRLNVIQDGIQTAPNQWDTDVEGKISGKRGEGDSIIQGTTGKGRDKEGVAPTVRCARLQASSSDLRGPGPRAIVCTGRRRRGGRTGSGTPGRPQREGPAWRICAWVDSRPSLSMTIG